MIAAIASHLPPDVLTNDDLARQFPEWTAEDILRKTGIRSRHVAAADVCASDLACEAARQLAKPADLSQTDLLLFCTQSPDHFLPTTACLLQHRLGLPTTCGAFDFNLGCSGYVYGLALADGMLRSGHAQRVLLLTADTYTRFLAPEDKGTRTIFGDAGTATWLSHDSPHRLRAFVWGTDGSGAEQLIVPGGALRRPDTPPTGCLAMNGPEVFNFTLQAVPPMVRAVAEKAGLTFEQIDLFVFHQANAFMLEHLRRKLAIPREKFLLHLAEVGNTVSSTIPLALQAALESGQIKPGMNILLAGFGVGLSWAGCVVEWNG